MHHEWDHPEKPIIIFFRTAFGNSLLSTQRHLVNSLRGWDEPAYDYRSNPPMMLPTSDLHLLTDDGLTP
jgi:hypothetical protein